MKKPGSYGGFYRYRRAILPVPEGYTWSTAVVVDGMTYSKGTTVVLDGTDYTKGVFVRTYKSAGWYVQE